MAGTQRGLVFELLAKEKILVSYQDDATTHEEWDRYIMFMSTLRREPMLRFLVYAAGGAPTTGDQRRVIEIVKGHEWPVAIVTTSAALSFVASVFSFVNKKIRPFAPSALPSALQHLQCTAAEKEAAEAALVRLSGRTIDQLRS